MGTAANNSKKSKRATKSRRKGRRADPTKVQNKEARLRTIKSQKTAAALKLAEQRKVVEDGRARLAELAKGYGDGANLDLKDKYESIKERVAQSDSTLIEFEIELKNLDEEERLAEEIGVKYEDSEEEGGNNGQELFVCSGESSSLSNKLNGKPLIDLTAPNGNSKPLIVHGDSDNEEEALFTPAQAREATGQNYGGKIVAWRQQDRSKPVIFMYGPQNAAKYERSTAAREDNDFDKDETPQFGPDHRLGDEKVNKKFVRKRRELLGIMNLAYNCDLTDLRPREKGEQRKVAPLKILVKWEISGEVKKVWEIRSSIRHLFSNAKKCDTYIYEAAKWHATRHQEWMDGQREAKDKSPTPAPNSKLSPTPEPKPIKTEGDDNGNNPVPSPPAATNGAQSSKVSKREAMLQYREKWCDLKGIDSGNMDPAAEGRFLKAWNEIKDTL